MRSPLGCLRAARPKRLRSRHRRRLQRRASWERGVDGGRAMGAVTVSACPDAGPLGVQTQLTLSPDVEQEGSSMWRSTAVLRSVDALKDSGFRNLPGPDTRWPLNHRHEEEQSQSWRSAHPPDELWPPKWGGDTRATMPIWSCGAGETSLRRCRAGHRQHVRRPPRHRA